MKKIIYYIVPFVAAVVVFAVIVIFINQKTGKGALQVTSKPPSDVYLNGKMIGTTPVCKCDQKDMIGVGEYRLRLVPKDTSLPPYEEKIEVTNSTLTVVDKTFGDESSGSIITLTPIRDKKDAQLMVISSPDKSDLALDDNPQEKTPVLLKNLTESDHEIQLKKEGYIDKILRIRTTKGFLLKAIVYLSPNSSGSNSALPNFDPTPTIAPTSSVSKVLILDTPTGFLRVRSSSSASTSEVGRVTPGETYDVLEEDEGWYKIKLKDGTEGWVSSQYAKKQ
ncbi:MAG: SH3 domain-containing protein [Patescibacteria group bacterium]|mgnify:FL=1